MEQMICLRLFILMWSFPPGEDSDVECDRDESHRPDFYLRKEGWLHKWQTETTNLSLNMTLLGSNYTKFRLPFDDRFTKFRNFENFSGLGKIPGWASQRVGPSAGIFVRARIPETFRSNVDRAAADRGLEIAQQRCKARGPLGGCQCSFEQGRPQS